MSEKIAPLIKVCGMRNAVNIKEVAELYPALMGFIFYPPSKRYVGEGFSLPAGISRGIETVGVFVNESPSKVIETLKAVGLTTAQLHGNETPDECLQIRNQGFKVMKHLELMLW
ncbi:MAG: hypothetical protein HC905_08650 [Bacteroidales bacterium]|nr:hypothetical protein [Bacteroidales bacterium]